MGPDTTISPVTSDSPSSPLRRSLLSLFGAGAIAGSLAGLVSPESSQAKKKKKKGKKKKKKGGSGSGGNNRCTGSVNGSASASEEADLLSRINSFRATNGGLPPLTRQAQLDSAALAHSQDMATRCYFDHVNPDGTDPFERMDAAGYPGVPVAENIYKGSGNFGSAAEAFDAWKNSAGHRANMLTSDANQIGIGTAIDGAGFTIWTNVFGQA